VLDEIFKLGSPDSFSARALILKAIRPCAVKESGYDRLVSNGMSRNTFVDIAIYVRI